mmetsp:Transcript_17172/g.65544  ORF Transcript_17172/g.65544 Transcript_17172/m.65544 type:complete len:567 (-) Transcript_17172:24-1724(-)
MEALRALAADIQSEPVRQTLAAVWAFLEELSLRTSDALRLSWIALKGWSQVFWLLGVAIASLATRIVFPVVRALFKALWRHQRRQPWPVLLGEAAVLVAALLLYSLQRFVRRRKYIPRARAFAKSKVDAVRNRYERFVAGLKKTNASVAAAFPHLLVAFLMLCSWRLLPKTVADLADSGALTFLTLILPGALLCVELVDENPAKLGMWYRFWAASAMLQSVEDVLRLVPFVGTAVAQRFAFLQTLKFYLYIYLLLPLGGTELLYRYVAIPLVSKYVGKVQLAPQTQEKSRSWLQMFDFLVTRFLGAPGKLLQKVLQELVTTLNEAPLMLMPLPTIFMPGIFTKCGIVYMARCYPAYATMQNPLTTAALVGGGRKNGKTKAAADSSDDAWKNDLRPAYYWCIAALVFFLKEAGVDDVLAWLPFSTTFQLLFFFWLQMPGFRGADYLFSRLLSALSSLLDAHLKQEPEPGQSGSRNQAGEAAETADPSSKPKVSKPGPVDDDEQRSIGEELKGDEAKASGRTGVVKSSQSEARSHKIERRRVVKDEAAGARRDETEDALTQRRSAPRK